MRQDPGKREAQRTLASEVTTLVHGEENTRKAVKISQALFYGNLAELEEDEIEQGFGDVPTYNPDEPEIGLVDLLVNAGGYAAQYFGLVHLLLYVAFVLVVPVLVIAGGLLELGGRLARATPPDPQDPSGDSA